MSTMEVNLSGPNKPGLLSTELWLSGGAGWQLMELAKTHDDWKVAATAAAGIAALAVVYTWRRGRVKEAATQKRGGAA